MIFDFFSGSNRKSVQHTWESRGQFGDLNLRKKKNLDIPIVFQNLEFCQNQRPRFSPIEAASYPGDRSDAEKTIPTKKEGK